MNRRHWLKLLGLCGLGAGVGVRLDTPHQTGEVAAETDEQQADIFGLPERADIPATPARTCDVTRRLVECDIALTSIDGESRLAYFRDCYLEFSVEEIDVSALPDSWERPPSAVSDWRATCNRMVFMGEGFSSVLVGAAPCIVSAYIGDETFSGRGIIVRCSFSIGGENSIVVVSAPEAIA